MARLDGDLPSDRLDTAVASFRCRYAAVVLCCCRCCQLWHNSNTAASLPVPVSTKRPNSHFCSRHIPEASFPLASVAAAEKSYSILRHTASVPPEHRASTRAAPTHPNVNWNSRIEYLDQIYNAPRGFVADPAILRPCTRTTYLCFLHCTARCTRAPHSISWGSSVSKYCGSLISYFSIVGWRLVAGGASFCLQIAGSNVIKFNFSIQFRASTLRFYALRYTRRYAFDYI